VQRELARLARGAAEDQQPDRGGNGETADRSLGGECRERTRFQDSLAAVEEKQRAGGVIEPDQAEEQSQVADTGGDEGLLRRGGRRRFVEPEPDEEVGGEADQFPANEEQQQAVSDEEAEHRRGKEAQEAEELFEVGVLRHVAGAEDEDQQADEGHHHAHQRGQRVQQPAEAQRPVSEVEPREVVDGVDGRVAERGDERPAGQ